MYLEVGIRGRRSGFVQYSRTPIVVVVVVDAS